MRRLLLASLLLPLIVSFSIETTHATESEFSGRLISLDLQDTNIHNALRIIAEVSNLNIVAHPEVHGKVTMRLIDVPWDQALSVILKTHGLYQVREGNVIIVAPYDKVPELFFSSGGFGL